MSRIGDSAQAAPKAPPTVFVLKAEHWASSYEDRPLCDMPIGLRMLSDEELDSCRDEAEKAAAKKIDDGAESYTREHNAVLIRTAIARAICMPDNAAKAHEFFPCPDEQLHFALRKETIVTLFDLVERTQLENSPVCIPADDDDVLELVTKLSAGALDTLEADDPVRAERIRRLFTFILTEL